MPAFQTFLHALNQLTARDEIHDKLDRVQGYRSDINLWLNQATPMSVHRRARAGPLSAPAGVISTKVMPDVVTFISAGT